MSWGSLLRYFRANWRAFVSVSALGIALGTIITPWILTRDWLRNLLASENQTLHVGVLALVFAALVVAWPQALDFWRRYRRTQALPNPPLQHSDIVTCGIFAALVTSLVVVQRSRIELAISDTVNATALVAAGLLFAWILGSWAWSNKKASVHLSAAGAGQHSGDYADDPITRDEDDLLGRIHFVDKLFEQIVKLPSPNSFVFGLYGSWGEGKTSVLKLLQLRLANTDLLTVSFNPWYFADETALVRAFYSRMEQELGRLYMLSGLRRTIRRYKTLLTSALGYLGIQFALEDDPEKLRGELESWITRIGCRVVIIIDDIDRLQAEEMLAVLKLARLSAKLQNTVFLLSLDHLVVIETLKNSAKLEPAFLEKIIQKPVPLPPAEQRDIDRFLLFLDPQQAETRRSAIDLLLDDLHVEPKRRKEFDDKFVYFYQTAVRRLFRTMRDAKRYANSLRATLPPILDEVNLYDFFLLEVLQVFFPKIYRDIWSNPWFYLPRWSHEMFLVYPSVLASDHDEKYRLIREQIEGLLAGDVQKEIAREILEELFFVEVKNAFNRHGRMGHDSMAETYLATKRLTHPKCFPRYFLFRLPAGELADAGVETLIGNWNTAPDSETRVYEDLYEHQKVGQLLPLFEKIRVFRFLVDQQRVPRVSRSICRLTPILSGSDSIFSTSESATALSLLLALIEDRAALEEIKPLVQELVAILESFPFLVMLIDSCCARDPMSYVRIQQNVDIIELRKLAANRLHEHFIEERRNIFEELSGRDLRDVIYYWATNWRTNDKRTRLIVQQYVLDLIDCKPEYLGRLLWEFRTKSMSALGERIKFDYVGFMHAFDSTMFAERLARYGETALITPEAKQIAGLFYNRYEAEQPTEQDPNNSG